MVMDAEDIRAVAAALQESIDHARALTLAMGALVGSLRLKGILSEDDFEAMMGIVVDQAGSLGAPSASRASNSLRQVADILVSTSRAGRGSAQ